MMWKVERHRQLYLETLVFIVEDQSLSRLIEELMVEKDISYIKVEPTLIAYVNYENKEQE